MIQTLNKAARRAHDFIMALPHGYATATGERQRISIARAILKNAPIMLLDEATAAIDPTNERAIQSALHALVADKTAIVVAHRLSTIGAADQIFVMENGQLFGRGGHDTLAGANDLYGRLWRHWNAAAQWRLGGAPRHTGQSSA